MKGGGQNKLERSEIKERLKMTVQGWKGQKQVVIKHKTTTYAEACYFAMIIEGNWA